jgi:hypothetical protein
MSIIYFLIIIMVCYGFKCVLKTWAGVATDNENRTSTAVFVIILVIIVIKLFI